MVSFSLFSRIGFDFRYIFQNGNDTTTKRRTKVDPKGGGGESTTIQEKATPQQRRMGQQKQHRPKGGSCTTPKGRGVVEETFRTHSFLLCV